MKILQIIFLVFGLTFVLSEDEYGRISGGYPAERGQFPHHVYIEIARINFISICGGALVRYNWVLTAAHCVYDSTDLRLYFGRINAITGDYSRVEHILGTENIKIHPEFDRPIRFANDLALIFLPTATPPNLLDPYIDLIKLPTRQDGSFWDGRWTIATGFGRYNDSGDGVFSPYLRYVSKRAITGADCALHHGFHFYDDKFCTDGTAGSTCMGDEGAPLITDMGDGRTILIGIGSVGLDKCTQGIPPLFTNIMNHLDWIESLVDQQPAVTPPAIPTITTDPTTDLPTTTSAPEDPNRCKCECHCYTCPGPAPNSTLSTFWGQ